MYLSPVDRKKQVFQWRPMQFPHERNDRARKPQCSKTFQAVLLTKSKCVDEKKYPMKKSTMGSFSDNRADIL